MNNSNYIFILEIKDENAKIEQPDLLLMSRDAAARSELQNGSLALHVISCDPNNYDKLQMKYLMNCLLVFQQSLTNMPPAYMARLVFDPRHRKVFYLKWVHLSDGYLVRILLGVVERRHREGAPHFRFLWFPNQPRKCGSQEVPARNHAL